jgi:hypothetical protein
MTPDDDAVLTLVRAADPLDEAEIESWASSPAAAAILDRVLARPPRARRRARTLVGAVVVGTAAVGVGVAAASGIIGRPAPDRVVEHLAELDRGLPADLRANPQLQTARSVAASATATLFAASTADGGYCIEVVTGADVPRGATCVRAAERATRPLEVTSPLVSGDEPVVLAGRADVTGARSVQLVQAGGAEEDVAVTGDGYWIVELTGDRRSSALATGVTVRVIGAGGAVLAEQAVPALADVPPPDSARPPVEMTTVSDGDDLTLVLAVEGTARRPVVAMLELTFPDGEVVPVAVQADGTFRYDLPADRRDDLDGAPAHLLARDAARHVVDDTPVASVAYWRRHLSSSRG